MPSTGARPGHSRPARCAAGQWLDSRTSAIRHLDPPWLLESRPSYRLLGEQLDTGTLHFGPAASFDKLDVSEALGRELAITCLRREGRLPDSAEPLRDALPFRTLIGDPFDPISARSFPR